MEMTAKLNGKLPEVMFRWIPQAILLMFPFFFL